MDLSPGQQRGLFVVIVIVLAGFGIYIATTGDRPASKPADQSASAPSTVGVQPPPSVAPSTAAPGASAAPPEGSTSTTGQANIYDWLPFSQSDLTAASHAALTFASDYVTWSYTESPAAYVAKMNGVVTGQLASTLEASYGSPQTASQRTQGKQQSKASGGITQIRSFSAGSRSITFLVNIAETLNSSGKSPQASTTQYAITCVPGPGTWEVNDIEYASAGNS